MTVSWFFRSVLDLDEHESEAMELAGLVSPTVAERLAATLLSDADAGAQADLNGSLAATDDEPS